MIPSLASVNLLKLAATSPHKLSLPDGKSMFTFNFHSLKEDFSRDFCSDSREQSKIATDGFGRKAPKKTFEWMKRFSHKK